MNKNFWTDVAQCKNLQGNDLRVVMFCHNHDRVQRDMLTGLGIKKTNASAICKKLVSMNLLQVEEQHGLKFYRANQEWTNDQLPGQMAIAEKGEVR